MKKHERKNPENSLSADKTICIFVSHVGMYQRYPGRLGCVDLQIYVYRYCGLDPCSKQKYRRRSSNSRVYADHGLPSLICNDPGSRCLHCGACAVDTLPDTFMDTRPLRETYEYRQKWCIFLQQYTKRWRE